MNRYFFYMIFMTMIVNVMAYVPNILIAHRYNGGIMGMLVGVVISTAFVYIFSNSLKKFPGMGLPEIFKQTIPTWLRNLFLLFFASLWYMAGALVLVTFSIITKRFISPDISLANILLLFMLVTSYTAVQSSKTQLYILEIILIISAPFIFFIILKALTSKQLMWNAIAPLKYYIWKFPTFTSISASTYTFVGYLNMVIFHREFRGEFKIKYFWTIPIFGLFNLFVSMVTPIGFHGSVGVDDYPFPWVTTADAMRLELAFIERVIFPFLLMYVLMCLLFASIGWHVSMEIIKSVFPKPKADSKWKYAIPFVTLLIFMIIPVLLVRWTDMPVLQRINNAWINIRFMAEAFLVAFLFFLAKKRGKA